MMKNIIIVALTAIIALISPNVSAQSNLNFKLRTVVLDAGHGAHDPGTHYGSYKEKDITLAVALLVGKKIKEKYSDVKVIYTRSDDTYIALHERSRIANSAAADLFMSIHVNSAGSSSARGTETFLMGYDKSKQNLAVAQKENEVVTMENGYKQKYEGFDPNSVESYIIFSLMQYSYLEQSTQIATLIENEYRKNTFMPSRGVKQAPFLVLWQTTTPSILTEIGFLSNSQDRAILTSKSGQEKIATSIFNAFCIYKSHVESTEEGKGGSSVVIAPPKANNSSSNSLNNSNIEFRVQVASSLKPIAMTYSNFGSYYNKVELKKIDGRYKYFVGVNKSYKETLSLQKQLRSSRFKDAFITAFDGSRQISASEGRKLSRQ